MAQHVLDIPQFRARFVAFSNITDYPDATLEVFWTLAVQYMGDVDGWLLCGDPLQLAIELMMAHLLASYGAVNGGSTPGVITSSTIDKVTVQLAAPPYKNGWQFWLSTTPYGLQLWALLSARSAGGFYLGGLPERGSIRKVGGTFWPF